METSASACVEAHVAWPRVSMSLLLFVHVFFCLVTFFLTDVYCVYNVYFDVLMLLGCFC